jgi:hypothetical protein
MDTQTIMTTVIVVACLTAFLTYLSYRQKQSSWMGTVIAKHHEPAYSDENSSSPEKYKVIFKTDSGRKVTVDLFEKDYELYQIGDRAEKKSGEYFPEKLSS